MSATNDTADLEALFDSIAADFHPAPVAVPSKIAVDASGSDNDELQALFDSVLAESAINTVESRDGSVGGEEGWSKQEAVFNRLGHMARSLHDTLGQLGYDKLLEKAATALPDAKDRLAYVANLTEQAACRVLNATDIASPLVDDIQKRSSELGSAWDKVFANEMSPEQFRQLAIDTRTFLKQQLPEKTQATHAQLTEIMMAQDFQDLTGQVIKKIVVLAQELETGLMSVLIDVVPEAKRTEEVTTLMNGPVINSEGRTDVVINQGQVDDLLDSLGF